VKGRMYALDAKTGKIVWEFYLVPKAEGDPTRGPIGASPLNVFRRGVPTMIGAGIPQLQFNEINGLKGSP
jgi:hypothetical protein